MTKANLTTLPTLEAALDPTFRLMFGDFDSTVAVELTHSADAGWCFAAIFEHRGDHLVRSHWSWDREAEIPADLQPYIDTAIQCATRTAPAPTTKSQGPAGPAG